MTNETGAGDEEVNEEDDHEGRYPGGYLVGAETGGHISGAHDTRAFRSNSREKWVGTVLF